MASSSTSADNTISTSIKGIPELDTPITPNLVADPNEQTVYLNYIFFIIKDRFIIQTTHIAIQINKIEKFKTKNIELLRTLTNKQVQLDTNSAVTNQKPITPCQTQKNLFVFKNEKSNILVQQKDYQSWKLGLQFYWIIDSQLFAFKQKKINHTINLFDNQVQQERITDITRFVDDPTCFDSAVSFLAKLNKLYISVDIEREASLKFDKLSIGSKESFSAFFFTLSHLANSCHKSDCKIINAMKQKVTTPLRILVINNSNPYAANDVDS
ncbi:hypothetical protein OCU04_008505 [Sclerotinia nivalis]|uniref:Uncharacterized protein n=1 Tax=Sclerotinia nivalis TaxID=352851 RepID=A0A9X0DHN9_9HELO|nr:hypothetical protein OCU04_008505 [Sclerotinia nivalis]